MEIINTRIVGPEQYAIAFWEAFGYFPPHSTAIAEIWLADGSILWSFGDSALEAELDVYDKLVKHVVSKWAVEVDRLTGLPFELECSKGEPDFFDLKIVDLTGYLRLAS